MSNTTLTADIIAKEALAILDNELGWLGRIHRAFEDEFEHKVNGYKIGDTLSIRRPPDFTVRSGATMNLYSQIGMILLIGIVAKNSILLVEYANQLKAKGLDTIAAVLESGRIRLRPILMTSVSTIMGAVPIAWGVGAGSASRKPLGYAIVGGVLFSTVLTLFVVPAAYVVLDSLIQRVRERRGRLVPVEGEGD